MVMKACSIVLPSLANTVVAIVFLAKKTKKRAVIVRKRMSLRIACCGRMHDCPE